MIDVYIRPDAAINKKFAREYEFIPSREREKFMLDLLIRNKA